MTIWGVDLGVRSFHAAGLSPLGHLELFSYLCVTPKKVREQGSLERSGELSSLGTSLTALMAPGDEVYIEEPPAAGAKNLRTFLKLAQVSGVLAFAARNGGASAAFVPVDTWKKDVIGRGGVSKDGVAEWLQLTYPRYRTQCGTDQNFIDATCIALSRAPGTWSLDYPHSGMAAS